MKDDVKVFGYASIFDDAEVSGTGFVLVMQSLWKNQNFWKCLGSNESNVLEIVLFQVIVKFISIFLFRNSYINCGR